MKYIANWSGGKDSTDTIILAHEHGEPLDLIVFSEVLFDKKNNISGENPKHIDFIMNVAKPLFESWGYEVIILRANIDYLDVFQRIIEHPRKHMEHKGKKYGFVISGMCSVKRECKMKPLEEFYSKMAEPIMQYVGICADEKKRLTSLHTADSKISLLEKYGHTEKMAMENCRKYGLLSPIYQFTKRSGCWFCSNAKLCEHEELRKRDPDTWYRFVELENDPNIANGKWNAYTQETLREREEKLRWRERQTTIFDFLIE